MSCVQCSIKLKIRSSALIYFEKMKLSLRLKRTISVGGDETAHSKQQAAARPTMLAIISGNPFRSFLADRTYSSSDKLDSSPKG